jgi:hypothetical protein
MADATTTTPAPATPDPGMLNDWYTQYMGSTPQTAQAQTSEWTPDANATVAGQVAKITSEASPLNDLAKTQAAQQANKRGLLNSSIAVGAGQKALYESALPIAQQDAATYARAGEFNAGAKNAASTFNAGQQNQAAGQQAAIGAAGYQQQVANTQQTALQKGDQAFTTSRDAQLFQNRLNEINAQTEAQLRLMDAESGTKVYDTYRQTSQQTYDAYIAAVQQIQTSDMDEDVKKAQIANLQTMFSTRQDFINSMFAEMPQWQGEWSQFAISFT